MPEYIQNIASKQNASLIPANLQMAAIRPYFSKRGKGNNRRHVENGWSPKKVEGLSFIGKGRISESIALCALLFGVEKSYSLDLFPFFFFSFLRFVYDATVGIHFRALKRILPWLFACGKIAIRKEEFDGRNY